jgi:hypothetical protein
VGPKNISHRGKNMYKQIKFPIEESFKDCAGVLRNFVISLHHPMIEDMHVVSAREVDPQNNGYDLSASSPCQSEALTLLSKKIRKALSTRYLSGSKTTGFSMTHDTLVGFTSEKGVLIDDILVPWEKFISLFGTPGNQIELIVSDAAD